MTTVHMIGSAHIDPVWLWRWPAGVVEALSTCRTAADLLEEYPDAFFTRSDQWIYEQVENADPDLFQRILRLIAAGRWAVVGGWYVQPDCNIPLAESFQRHMRYGKEHARSRLGVEVTVGYNVDSFGHSAMLPSLLVENGYTSYVMMRPGPHEKTLPTSLFRWRSPDGREVVTWRIVNSYNCSDPAKFEPHVRAAVEAAHPEVPHVMCFYGVGDHGGGPSRVHLDWIRSHRDALPGIRIEFSHPARFFDAVLPYRDRLPVVQEELQFHAIGCYSVVREIKTGVRRAEHALLRAETCLRMHPSHAPASGDSVLEGAWKEVLFNQFHDILAGSSIAEAYRDSRDQLGLACTAADDTTSTTLFRSLVALPPSARQRIVESNLSARRFEGPVAHEAWTEWRPFTGRLEGPDGAEVPYQLVQQPAILGNKKMLLWMEGMEPASTKELFLVPQTAPGPVRTDLAVFGGAIGSSGLRVRPGAPGGAELLFIERSEASRGSPVLGGGIRLAVIEDASDTWSHGIGGYDGAVAGEFLLTRATVEESGPVRATLRLEASWGRSAVCARVRLYAGAPYLDIDLELSWLEKARIAKLILPLPGKPATRRDGIPGGSIDRTQDGREYPLVDWTLTPAGLAVAAPDCFALDGRDGALRFTLVRSPVYAWHDPTTLDPAQHYRHTDQGEHQFRFRLRPEATATTAEEAAASLHDPPVCLDWTRGMGKKEKA